MQTWGLSGGSRGKEQVCQYRKYKRHGFDPWVGKVPLREGMTTQSSILAWIIQWTEESRTHTHKLACPKILTIDRKKGMGEGDELR